MSRHRRPFREHFLAPHPEPHFRWRGREVSRIEGFSDAVFAFAVTLLVVALEVPHTFDEFLGVVRNFPPFIATFALLMIFWNEHYRFFRRYGLQDKLVIWVNHSILLLVLFSVYPLKYLFTLWLGGGGQHGANVETEARQLFTIYGLGFAGIWLLFALLEWHALRLSRQLQLSPLEEIYAIITLRAQLICVGISLLSVLLARLHVHPPGLPGWIYALFGPLLALNGWWHGRRVRALRAGWQSSHGGERRRVPD
jgi:uncharacterized membrane protein